MLVVYFSFTYFCRCAGVLLAWLFSIAVPTTADRVFAELLDKNPNFSKVYFVVEIWISINFFQQLDKEKGTRFHKPSLLHVSIFSLILGLHNTSL